MQAVEITIRPDGSINGIWDDALVPLVSEGHTTIRRVSHVEPTEDGEWTATMVDGPVLGPFTFHSEALAAEREWLRQAGW